MDCDSHRRGAPCLHDAGEFRPIAFDELIIMVSISWHEACKSLSISVLFREPLVRNRSQFIFTDSAFLTFLPYWRRCDYVYSEWCRHAQLTGLLHGMKKNIIVFIAGDNTFSGCDRQSKLQSMDIYIYFIVWIQVAHPHWRKWRFPGSVKVMFQAYKKKK